MLVRAADGDRAAGLGSEEVGAMCTGNRSERSGADPRTETVRVPVGRTHLAAHLTLPAPARAVVVFARCSEAGRPCPRDAHAAARLHRAGIGTLRLDLLTGPECGDRHNHFDGVLLARRLEAATRWLRRETGLPVGYVGAGAGTPAALRAAAADGDVGAVVALGGRPELAGPAALSRVRAPVLLVSGGLDPCGAALARLAADWLRCPHEVTVVPHTTGDLAGPEADDRIAGLIHHWFTDPSPSPRG